MKNISVIIKALNEEKNIAVCIESAMAALKEEGGDNEIILVDSYSKDRTVEIAKKYPIKILQLKKEWIKTPAAALQTGYLYSQGKYIYALDGDMYLKKRALNILLHYLKKDDNLAGVAGLMIESIKDNIISKRFHRRYYNNGIKIGYVNYLDGGGLYRRDAIEKVGHLSNHYLRSAEESELGFRLRKKKYQLLRIGVPLYTHNFYGDTSLRIMYKKWKRGYLFGFGQVLRIALKEGFFFEYIKKLKLYISILIWFFLGIVSIISLVYTKIIIDMYFMITLLILILILLKKRDIIDFLFSIFSWILQIVGIVIGFFKPIINPEKYPKDVKIIQNGKAEFK